MCTGKRQIQNASDSQINRKGCPFRPDVTIKLWSERASFISETASDRKPRRGKAPKGGNVNAPVNVNEIEPDEKVVEMERLRTFRNHDRNPLIWLLLFGIGGCMAGAAWYLRKKDENDKNQV